MFLGRWLPFLRITAAWLAGANHMPWPQFLAWNAAGGIAWAISVGVLAYLVGDAAIAVLHDAGYVGLGSVALVARRRRRLVLFKRRQLDPALAAEIDDLQHGRDDDQPHDHQ